MTLIAFLCFVICVWIVASTFRRDADVFSPSRVFGFIWSLAIGLAEFKLSRLQHEWSFESWVILLIGPLSFLVGLFAVYALNLGTHFVPISELRQAWCRVPINNRRLFNVIVILFVTYLLAYGAIILVGRDIPLFSSNPGQARLRFHQTFGVGLLLHNFTLIVFFSVVYFLSGKGDKRKKRYLVWMSAISFLLYSLTLGRFPVAVTVILVFTLFYYMSQHLRFGTVAPFFVLGLAFIYGVSTLRMNVTLSYFVYVTSKMKVAPQFVLLTEPYMYIVMCVENFARAIDRIDYHTFGYYTFDFVTAISGLKHWIREYFNINDEPYLVSGYNVYTAFWTYYRDFGVVGLFLVSIVGGASVGTVYYSLRKNPNLTNLSLYSVAVFLMTMSFFNSQTGFLWFAYVVAVLYLVLRTIGGRRNNLDERPSLISSLLK